MRSLTPVNQSSESTFESIMPMTGKWWVMGAAPVAKCSDDMVRNPNLVWPVAYFQLQAGCRYQALTCAAFASIIEDAQAVMAVQVDLCMGPSVSSNGTAAVVDGCRVLLTPLQRTLVPPPMCAVAAIFHQPVQSVAFGNHQGNEVC